MTPRELLAYVTAQLAAIYSRFPIKGNDLDPSAVGTASLADDSVSTVKIQDSAVTSAKIADGTIVNADVSSSAAIAYSKLNLATSIVNADISASAAIAQSKLALSITNSEVNASAAIAYSKLNLSGSIVNADVNSSAAIAYSKLNLTGSIVNADVSGSAAIAYSKLNLSNSIVAGDLTSNSVTNAKLNSDNFTATVPTAAAVSNAVGVATTVSRSDHAHGIANSSVTNAMLAGSIAASKLTAGSNSTVLTTDSGGTVAFTTVTNAMLAGSIAYSKLSLTGSIVNADVSSSAAIAYSKLSLTGSIVNADIGTSAAIAYSKLNLTSSIVVGDIANSPSAYQVVVSGSGSVPAWGQITNSHITSGTIMLANLNTEVTDAIAAGGGFGSVLQLGSTSLSLDGTDTTSARSDHVHGVANGTISNAMLAGSIAATKLSAGSASTVLTTDSGGTVGFTTVTNAMLAGSIAYSKLSLTGAIVNADISSSAAIAYSKLSLSNSIVAGDLTSGSVTNAKMNSDNYSATAPVAVNTTATVGADSTFSRSDHRHTLTAGVVDATALASNAVTTVKINANAVTNAKLNSDNYSGSVTAIPASSSGAATTVARSDHSHTVTAGSLTNNMLAGSITPDKFSLAHFSARRSANTAGVTGNGTTYTIIFDSADVSNAAYSTSTGTYTAPATGAYNFELAIGIAVGAAAQTQGILRLVTSARTYRWDFDPYTTRNSASGASTIAISKICDMTASDTAYVTLQISGGPSDSAIVVGNTITSTYSGFRIA